MPTSRESKYLKSKSQQTFNEDVTKGSKNGLQIEKEHKFTSPISIPDSTRISLLFHRGRLLTTIHSLVVLTQLSSEHGYQVKYSLDFSVVPNGTIGLLITHAIQAAEESGARSITFGAVASPSFMSIHLLKGMKVKILSHSYKSTVEFG